MINIYSINKNKLTELKIDEIDLNKNSPIWVNLNSPTEEEVKTISKIFDIHPTVQEDILSSQTRIKYEEFEKNTLVVFKVIRKLEDLEINSYNISFIIGEHFLITSEIEKNENITHLQNNQKKLESILKKGESYLMHYILDKEVDKCMQIKTDILEDFKKIEKEFVKNPNKEVLNDLFEKELMILEIRQQMESIVDLCLNLIKPTENYIHEELIPYFRDIYDHVFKITESFKGLLGRINGMRNSYQSLISNKLSETMKVLTILMAIMMPLTVITGFYGMNVKLPFQNHPDVYLFILGLMIVSGVFLVWMSRIRGWITREER